MSQEAETAKDLAEGALKAEASVKRWLKEIDAASRHENKWREKAAKVVKRFRDERDDGDSASRFNVLYANTEVLKGVMYQQTPTPQVKRRYFDKDPIGRAASQVLERCLSYSADSYDFDTLMRASVEDVLLPGRAVARVKYVPTIVEGAVVYEDVRCDYVEWDMFRYSPAKRWDKVRWVAFGEMLTRDDLKQFGPTGAEVKLDHGPEGQSDEDKDEIYKRALVWTIWDKQSKTVYVVSSGYDKGPLAVIKDPLGLEGFFPIPRPVYSICTTGSLVPIPEYCQYQDQAMELDAVTGRINVLVDALRRRGVYDASFAELHRLAKAGDNQFIAVENYANLVEKGGIEKAFQELPIEGVAKVVIGLYEAREQIKRTIYEVTGISDVIRGSSTGSQTATEQQLKAQYGNSRISPRQAAIQNFARDLFRLKGEIISEHFSLETIKQMSGLEYPDEVWMQVHALLKNEKMRGFRIDIETDSTIRPDQDSEKAARTELLTALGTFIPKAAEGVQMGALSPQVAQELILFAMRSYRSGEKIEELFEQFPPQPQQQGDNGEAAKAGADKMKAQLDAQIAQATLEQEKKIAGLEAMLAQQADETKMQITKMQEANKRDLTTMQEHTKLTIAEMNNNTKKEVARMQAIEKRLSSQEQARAKAAQRPAQ